MLNALNHPKDPGVHYTVGLALEALDRREEAVSAYEKAVSLAAAANNPLTPAYRKRLDALTARLR